MSCVFVVDKMRKEMERMPIAHEVLRTCSFCRKKEYALVGDAITMVDLHYICRKCRKTGKGKVGESAECSCSKDPWEEIRKIFGKDSNPSANEKEFDEIWRIFNSK